MKTDCFINYTSEDFIFDQKFRELVLDPESAQELKDLIESLPEKRYDINLAIDIIKGLHVKKFTQSSDRKNELWRQVELKSKQREQPKQLTIFKYSTVKYAAVILLLIGLGTAFYFFEPDNNTELAINDNLTEILASNQNDALLVLSNGETVTITNKESTVKYSNDGSRIKVNDSKDVQQSSQNTGINKMIIPYGKRSTITLSDGTKVWLNSGSTLIFPPTFTGNFREVQLIGEGFFDVTHNKEKPFYVKTDAFRMKVYGTRFNIQSYKQDNASSIVLVEGKVSMKSYSDLNAKEVFLAPSQRAILVDGSSNIQIDNIENIEEYTSWTEGYLSFSDEDITHLLKKVSRYYGVDIVVDAASIKKEDKIFGKLDLKDDIENVLNGISFISNTKYKKIGNKYEFYQ